jgi:taurine dioxygenase
VDTATSGKAVVVRPNSVPVGAEIVGVDLSRDIGDDCFRQIRDAYYRYSLLIVRDQNITPEQQIKFTRRFGELQLHHLTQYVLPEHPEILILSNIVENGRTIGLADPGRVSVWHTDLSYLKEPVAGSTLYAIEIPHDEAGEALGDTLFVSTFAAYDALPGEMKSRLTGLRAIHRMTKGGYESDGKDSVSRVSYSDEHKSKFVDQSHPIIRTHPVTGRKCIYINELCTTGIVGMPDSESGPLLQFLYAHCTQPAFIYRHKWCKGDFLMWDNCSALHFAVTDYALPLRRRMHRITLKGTVPA